MHLTIITIAGLRADPDPSPALGCYSVEITPCFISASVRDNEPEKRRIFVYKFSGKEDENIGAACVRLLDRRNEF